jgi:hypothetical protein
MGLRKRRLAQARTVKPLLERLDSLRCNPTASLFLKGSKMSLQSRYEALAQSDIYKTVDGRLKLITWSVATLSAVSTAYGNGFSHRNAIGLGAAVVLGILTLLIVEGTLYTLEQGLRSTFKGGTQRTLAWFGKWVIKITMIGNAMYLCCKIAAVEPPAWLLFWNRWSFAVHFGVGLILVPMIRDADPVVANQMLKLRAETAQADMVIARLAGALASPFAMFGTRLRGWVDGCKLGWRLAFNRHGFSPTNYVTNLNALAKSEFGYVENPEIFPAYLPSQSSDPQKRRNQ